MITQELKVEKKEAKGFDPLPENVYQVEIFDINLESKPTYDTRGKSDAEKIYENVLNFQFVLLGGFDKKGESLRGRSVFQNFVPTYLYISSKKGKNLLYQIIETVIRREMTVQEEAECDASFINSLVGQQVRVVVKNTTKDDKTFSNIESFLTIEEEKTSLTHEEREKAVIKKGVVEEMNEIAKEEEIPTINLYEEQDEVRIESVPF